MQQIKGKADYILYKAEEIDYIRNKKSKRARFKQNIGSVCDIP
jgi:hypothetical protein